MDSSKDFECTSSIKAIDKRSVHQLCSGQVILTLATAVKELVENSIDAGATNVEIKLKDFGIDSIEVHDNGSGIEEKDFESIAIKHCTSKLTDFSDLTMIETFGFRGEALSSLCALSKLTVITRHLAKPFGSKLEFDYDGRLASKTPCAREIGTTVIVNHLFHTLPVRHKEFQRNIKKEFPKLSAVLQAYGIISTGIRLSCINVADKNRKTTVVSTHGSDSFLDNIASIFGPKQVQNLLSITQREPTNEVLEHFKISPKAANESKSVIKIDGYISRVDHGCGRASPDRQFYFINKRPCDIVKVSRLINEAYHMFNRQQNPFVFLDIRLDSDMVDVNLTPDKRQIFVQHEKMLLATLKASLLYMFNETAGQYEIKSKIQDASTARLTSDQTDMPSQNASISCKPPSECQKQNNGPLLSGAKEFSKHGSRVSSVVFNGGSPQSSVLKNLSRKFSRSPIVESSQTSIEKFTYTVEKEKVAKKEIEKYTGVENEEFCGEDELLDITPAKQCSVISVSSDDSTLRLGCSPISRIGVSHGQEDNVGSERTVEKFTLTPEKVQGSNKMLEANGDSKDFVELDDSEDCSPIEEEDLAVESNTVQRFNEKSNSSPITFTSKQALNSPEIQVTNTSFESPLSKHGEVLSKTAGISDLIVLSDSEIPCKRIRFSRPEVKVPFDFKKLHIDIKSHASRTSNDHESCLGFHAKISPNQNGAAEEELRKNITKEMFTEMEVIGQFNLGFIIAKIHEDLFIIDQHATDEKFNFEALQKEHCLKGQRLLHPRPLELTPTNESILLDNIEIFRKNGYEFLTDDTQPSGNKVKLTSMPTSRNWTFGIEDIDELLFMLSDSPGVMCRPSRVRNMFASRACRMSTMVGTALNHNQMKTLLSHMSQIEHPWNCPHGRPTMRHLVNLNRITKKTDTYCQSEE